MLEYRIDTYKDHYLEAIVRFWNKNFKNKRNFFPITAEIFKERVINNVTAIEKFIPEHMILAIRENEVIGMIHVGINSEEFCKAIYPNWLGGNQGYIAFFCVDEDHRFQGVGGNLWIQAMKILQHTDTIIIDTQCINPFYGNSQGPFTPFWGNPEGIGISFNDTQTLGFLERRGFVPKYKAIQFEYDFKDFSFDVFKLQSKRSFDKQGLKVEVFEDIYPELGFPIPSNPGRIFDKHYTYWCITCVDKDMPVGYICVYPMKEVSTEKFAVYEAITLEAYQGRGIGSNLLREALCLIKEKGGRSCEAVCIKEISPAAYWMYISVGFVPVEEWAIF